MAKVHLEGVSKQFPDGTTAVDGITLEVLDREFLVLVGPSGCGKSTTLRLIAGLETCSGGVIRIGDRVVNDVAPKNRDIAMVFQNYALYPHMSVYKNLSFGLKLRSGGGIIARVLRRVFQPREAAQLSQMRGGIDQKVRQTAVRLGIEKLLDRKPHQLSGGERQRVALGRAIVRNPAAFLFDEPLSNLDAKLRQQMRIELKRLHRELKTTMIYVTHDQVEAMTLGDRVAVMNEGRILQLASPLDVYQRPANLFVARFIGSVQINLQPGTVRLADNEFCFGSRYVNIAVPGAIGDQVLTGGRERQVVIGVRPEHVSVTPAGAAGTPCAQGRVVAIDRLGDSAMLHLELADLTDGTSGAAADHLRVDGSTGNTLIARIAADTDFTAGDRVEIQMNPNRVLWFDADTGKNLVKDKS